MSAGRYTSSGQQILLAVYLALHEGVLAGATVGGLAEQCGISRDQAFRALKNLEHVRLVAAASDRTWRLTPRAAVLSERVRDALMARHVQHVTGDPRG